MTKPPTPPVRTVVPGSSRDEVVGWRRRALKIKVTAPPEKGRASEAMIEILADRLGVGTDDIKIVSGHSSPSKVVAISGVDGETIRKATLDEKTTRPSFSELGRVVFGSLDLMDNPALSSTLARNDSQQRPLKVLVGDLKIVLACYFRCIPQPSTYHMDWMALLNQLGFTG